MDKRVTTSEAAEKFGWLDLGRAIWHLLEPEKRVRYLAWTVFLAALSLYIMVPAYIIGRIVDFFAHWHRGDSPQPYYMWAILLGGTYCLNYQLRLHTKFALSYLQSSTIRHTKIEGFRRLMQFPLAWHAQENTGNRMQRIQLGVASVRDVLKIFSSNFFRIFVPLIATSVIFVRADWRLGAFTLVYLIIAYSNELIFYPSIKEAIDRRNAASERSSGTAYQNVSNLVTIKSLGAERAMINTMIAREDTLLEANQTSTRTGIAKWRYFQAINGFAYTAFIVILGALFMDERLKLGALFTFFVYFRNLVEGVSEGSEIVSDLTEALSGVGRMMSIFWEPIPADKGSKPFPKNWRSLEVVNGHFSYVSAGRPSLNGVNLVVGRGQTIGIAGGTGSGKSTLTKLLLGLYDFSKGGVEIGGISLADIRREAASQNITVVPQDTDLFNSSVLDNLTLCQEVTPELVEKALRIACLQGVIDRLPEGLDSLIGEKGHKLSGGERQRLGIARAICRGAEIIILDEATSHLDSKTEWDIQRGIETELGGSTLIIIAHRLSTLRNADTIYVFSQGEIVEYGSFDDLVATPGSQFGMMYAIQQMQGDLAEV